MTLSEAKDFLKARYADEKNEDLARELGVSVRTVERWAHQLGLKKSPEFMARCRWNAELSVQHMRLCGKRAGGVPKGVRTREGGFEKGHRWDRETEEKRKQALRDRGMDERRRIRSGEERKTRWRMDEKTWKGK